MRAARAARVMLPAWRASNSPRYQRSQVATARSLASRNDCASSKSEYALLAAAISTSAGSIANSALKANGNIDTISPDSPLTKSDDLDYDYGTGSITDGASASTANPAFSGSGWNYVLSAHSPAYGAPVLFPEQGSAWGGSGFWGPPGYVIPQTGTRPSYL